MRIKTEWTDAEGVRDPVLAQTWCKLSVSVGLLTPTRFLSFASNSVRDGVYVSAFPLARWLVSNWWSLLHEAMPAEAYTRGARALAHDSKYRPWLNRHSFLFAKEGFPLPDLIFFRDEDEIHLSWTADPAERQPSARGRFVEPGIARVPVDLARRALADFVVAVLDRLDGVEVPEVEALRDDWAATVGATPGDAFTFGIVGALGLDPFALDDEHFEQLEDFGKDIAGFPARTARDLLDAAQPKTLAADISYVNEGISKVGGTLARATASAVAEIHDDPPHLVGYQWARQLRNDLGIGPESRVDGMEAIGERIFGGLRVEWTARGSNGNVHALVAGAEGDLRVIAKTRSVGDQRFLLGRAFARGLCVREPAGARLLTGSADWGQRAGRAFAAEFLAPASALRRHIDRHSGDPISSAAAEFGVSELVVLHQLHNHGILLDGGSTQV